MRRREFVGACAGAAFTVRDARELAIANARSARVASSFEAGRKYESA